MTSEQKAFSEKRDYFRINFNTPVEYKTYSIDKSSKPALASRAYSRNISQSGICFQTEGNPPQLSSLLWMNLDMRTLRICQEIEKKALIFNNGLVGKVVRVEEDDENKGYDVGVCFLTADQKDSKEVSQILAKLAQKAK